MPRTLNVLAFGMVPLFAALAQIMSDPCDSPSAPPQSIDDGEVREPSSKASSASGSATATTSSSRLCVEVTPTSVETRLCLGSSAVPLEVFLADDRPRVQYMNLGSGLGKGAKAWWLLQAFRLATKDAFPASNVLDEIRTAIKGARGKRNRVFSKVDCEGRPMDDHLNLTVRGFDLGVRNSAKCLFIEASKENLEWLVEQLQADLGLQQPAAEGEGASASSQQPQAQDECSDSESDQPSDPEELEAKAEVKQLLSQKHDSCFYAPSLNALVVRDKSIANKSNKVFTIRHKAKLRSWIAYKEEVELQKHRALHFAKTSELLPNPPIEEVSGNPKRRRC